MAAEESKVVGVRMRVSVQEQLALRAKNNDRSLCGEILHRLKKSLEQDMENEKQQA
jgi:hypothetical protein